MATFSLDIEVLEEVLNQSVLVSTFEDQTEQRRLKTAKEIMGFRAESPNLTKTQMQAYRDFFNARDGALTAFEYTSPLDDTTYDVRFGEGGMRTSFRDGYYRCIFEFFVIGEA